MPLHRYGVLKGRPVDRRFAVPENPHFQIHLRTADDEDWRVSVNVRSQDRSDLLFAMNDNFVHPITGGLTKLPLGWNPLESRPGGLGLDYIRGNMPGMNRLEAMPFFAPGPDNDLNELLDRLMHRLRADDEALLYAFGERWGPERKPDKIFGFVPGNGVHDVHMNQGNDRRRAGTDGPWQDGGLLLHFPRQDRWIAVYLAFQSQAFHTDDRTGHRIYTRRRGVVLPYVHDEEAPAVESMVEERAGTVRIVALKPPQGNGHERLLQECYALIINPTPKPIDLTGWALLNNDKAQLDLGGVIEAGDVARIPLPPDFIGTSTQGLLTVVDDTGLKVDGIAFTPGDLSRPGWLTLF